MSRNLLFLGSEHDKPYAHRLKPMVGSCSTYVLYTPISTLTEIIIYCQKRNITGVFSTNTTLLHKLLATFKDIKKTPSLDNYAGSYIKHKDIEFVFINPLEQLITVPYGDFITRRFISKLSAPQTWLQVPQFDWSILTPANIDSFYSLCQTAFLISVDIETTKENLAIRCIGYTVVTIDDSSGSIHCKSGVLPLDSDWALAWMRKINSTDPAKILQNGKYDISYLLRYNAPITNYLWDTLTAFHAWYSELPKDLAFIFSFFIRESMYWKDLADTEDLHEYYRYNALDTYGTALAIIAWILEAPEWAKKNYQMEFPLLFPSILCEATGIKRDMLRMKRMRAIKEKAIEDANKSLSRMVGVYPSIFNTNSAPQNAALRKILGCEDLKSSDEKHLKKIGERHPLNKRIANKILDIRGDRKLVSTYLVEKEVNGRILYALNPHGTDTGRNASKEHHFWTGLQIQNIPRGEEVKCTLIADDGFRLAEVDLEQAESRGTGYIAGDTKLITAVEGERDFHSVNASAFFGVPFESIYSMELRKTIDKKLRDLAKRVNHGANYLMGPAVLVDTMGEANIWEAKRLLNLPRHYGLIDVATHLLAQFHRTYPKLSSTFYPAVAKDVTEKRMLVGATGWTRYCFGSPAKNKRDLNSYVAHTAQSLNAMIVNKAFMRIFYDIAINPEHRNNFKLLAQIHDSVLFQFRKGHEYLCDMVKERMEIPIEVKGYDGVTRTMIVPAAVKAGKNGKGAYRWSQTE